MIKKIPSELYKLYSWQSFRASFYTRVRWRLCPFVAIEKYIPKKAVVLDVGCGYGLLANYLALMSPERDVVGVDLSTMRVNAARKTVGNRKNIRFERINVKDIQMKRYDAIVMSDFLHHLDYETQEELFNLCYEKLSPGGQLFFEEVDDRPLLKYWAAYFVDVILNIGEGIYFRNRKTYSKILRDIGFEVHVEDLHKGIPWSDVIYICKKP